MTTEAKEPMSTLNLWLVAWLLMMAGFIILGYAYAGNSDSQQTSLYVMCGFVALLITLKLLGYPTRWICRKLAAIPAMRYLARGTGAVLDAGFTLVEVTIKAAVVVAIAAVALAVLLVILRFTWPLLVMAPHFLAMGFFIAAGFWLFAKLIR